MVVSLLVDVRFLHLLNKVKSSQRMGFMKAFGMKRHLQAPTRFSLIGACTLAFILVGCRGGDDDLKSEVRPVRAITINTVDSSGVFSLTGRVQAQTEVNQSFRLDGQLIERLVDIGDTVKSGQLIARLDSQNEESGLQAAQAQLVAAQVQLVDARNNFNRMRDLVVDDAVSRASYDHSVAVLQTAEAQLKSVQSQVTLAQNRLGFTRLFADVGGVVTARGAEPGEVVSAGRMIVQISQTDARDAVFDVPAQVKDNKTKNASIAVFLTSDPSIKAVGKVREVSPRADPVTGTFLVRVRLINAPPAMRLGSTVTGRITLASAVAMTVPSSALIRSAAKPAVWVVDPKTMTVSQRIIELRANDTASVQVASGLNAGDIVVTAGVEALRPGQKVRLLETKMP
jgi:RND family efflux transporter MFP subunit